MYLILYLASKLEIIPKNYYFDYGGSFVPYLVLSLLTDSCSNALFCTPLSVSELRIGDTSDCDRFGFAGLDEGTEENNHPER